MSSVRLVFPAASESGGDPQGGSWVCLLGVPTVADRIAQMVVKLYLEPKAEPVFHPDSYGYRRGSRG
jgi:RNA-directed DNA polymerase